MINIMNEGTDPHFNLALEEYFLTHDVLDDNLFILWQNRPAIIVGRHQNTLAEINYTFVKEHNIPVVRRLSGGGAVYHDLGNLNFTFIMKQPDVHRNDFSFFTQPIIEALSTAGIDAVFTGRNDITIDGKKFSGNAQYFAKNKMLHHGTLLFESDFKRLAEALAAKGGKFNSKAVPSNPSPVTNISAHLNRPLSLAEFKRMLTDYIFQYQGQPYREYTLSPSDLDEIHHLAQTRYEQWDWNFGHSPAHNFHQEKKFAGGTVHLYLNIVSGKITECSICGDFFTNADISELERSLTGACYDENTMARLLASLHAGQYFHNISEQELLSCFFPS